MAKKIKNPYKNNNDKSIKEFVNRDKYIEAFWKNYNNINDEDIKILSFYGVGGIGKSSLINELKRQVSDRNKTIIIHIDLDNISTTKNVENILIHVMDQLRKTYKMKFPIFDYALMLYLNMSNPVVKYRTEEIPYIEKSEFLTELIDAFGDIPFVGLIPSVLKLGVKGKNIIDKWSLNSKTNIIDEINNSTITELQSRLPKYLTCDIYDYIFKKDLKVVFFIDTYELAAEENRMKVISHLGEEWLNGDDGLIVNLPKTLWIIGSREKIRWNEYDDDWDECLEQYLIGYLYEKDAIRLLNKNDIVDLEICKKIYLKTQGHPFYLDVLIEIYKKGGTIEEIDEPVKAPIEIIKRFFRYLYVGEKELLGVLANADVWDKGLYLHICRAYISTGINITFDDLIKYSFISKNNDNTFELHSIMKECLLSEQNETTVININRFLFEYYSTKEFNFNLAFYHGILVSKSETEIKDFVKWFINSIHNDMLDLNLRDVYDLSNYIAKMNKDNVRFISELIEQLILRDDSILILNITIALYLSGNYKAAEKSISSFMVRIDENDNIITEFFEYFALIKNRLGNYNKAIEYIEKALNNRIIKEQGSINHANTLNNYAAILDSKGDLLVALEKHLDAQNIFENNSNIQIKEHSGYINNIFNICELYTNIGEVEKAIILNKDLIKIGEDKYGNDSLEYAKYVTNYGTLYMLKSEFDKADYYIEKGLKIRIDKLGKNHLVYSNSLRSKARLKAFEGDFESSNHLFETAIDLRKKYLGESHPYTVNVMALHLNVLIDYEKLEGFKNYLDRCIRFNKENPNITEIHPIQFHLYVSAAKYYKYIGDNEMFEKYNNYLKIIVENISKLNYSFDYDNVLKYIYP